ncbi:hypothetical protein ANN_26908 [Periplaneta americana]|nr:hypothetical protein ANN_26908 [Periplaneta americana]
MEMEAAITLWKRSEQFGLRYITVLSDGDAKTWTRLNLEKPYGPKIPIEKEECVNHVGKRLGTALRGARTNLQAQGIRVGGKGFGALKNSTINKLQNYYVRAIRSNTGDLHAMKTAVLATLFHCMSTDKKPQHTKCPPGSDFVVFLSER